MDTRREFIKKAILFSGTAGLSSAIPASIQRAFDIDPVAGSTYMDAEHVVILMQENRSFDHCFGTLRGVRGFNDRRTITLPDGNSVWLQSNLAGETYAPFRFNIRNSKITWMGSTPHGRNDQVYANNLGKYDQWLNAKGLAGYPGMPATLGHFNREDLPFNYGLADAFTICDQHYCSAMTSTWPNRLYMWGGTIRGADNGEAKAYITNSIPYGEARWKTFPERLEDNGISWKVYQNDLNTGGGFNDEERSWLANFICNLLEFLPQYNVKFSKRYIQSLQKRAQTLPQVIEKLEIMFKSYTITDKEYGKLKIEIAKKKEVLANVNEELVTWSQENFDKLTQYQKNLFNKAFTTNAGDPDYHKLTKFTYEDNGVQREMTIPKGDILYQFRKDVEGGQLPTVSWFVPPKNFSDHPTAPWYGNLYTSEILDILTSNPEVWKKTIFILTYDENDGYFDHIPPFVAPDPKDPRTGKCSPGVNDSGAEFINLDEELKRGVPKNKAQGGPIGLGYRVPMIIASPWTRGGKVCSQVFDHTSVLQFLEKVLSKKLGKEIRETNISEWRRTVCGDLTSAFTSFKTVNKEKVTLVSRDGYYEEIYNAKFKNQPLDFRRLSPEEIAQFNKNPHTSRLMPRQEPGVRASTALPYELYADGQLSDDKKHFEIQMEAKNSVFAGKAAGSPFIVYAPGEYLTLESEGGNEKVFEPVRAWHYAVKVGDALTDKWPLNAFKAEDYHLRLYGPNGFFREFKGDANDPAIQVNCDYQRGRMLKGRLTGNLEVKITNTSNHLPYTLKIIDHSRNDKSILLNVLPEKQEIITLDLKTKFQWYDFSVSLNDNPKFLKRYAGRVETGKEGFSDPMMADI